jgi:hypothetical protein
MRFDRHRGVLAAFLASLILLVSIGGCDSGTTPAPADAAPAVDSGTPGKSGGAAGKQRGGIDKAPKPEGGGAPKMDPNL